MNEQERANDHLIAIKKEARKNKRNVTIMEICGGHTNTIMAFGIRDILPKNINLISGPGCPVCVSSQFDIDCMIELAHNNIPIATYGDMLKVPGSKYRLEDAKAMYGNVFEIYSTTDVLKLKESYPDIVFFGIGFETTTPMAAFLLENSITVFSVHKLVPPALEILVAGDIKIDGFIDPGHVSAIIGRKPYDAINIPQVIAGFKPEQILRSLRILIELINDKKSIAINGYPEIVSEEGNKTAQKLVNKHFKIVDSEWRGFGVLPMSGLEVRDDNLNAKIKYKNILKNVGIPKKTGCKCGDVIQGFIEPADCPLYKKMCSPDNPVGPCMVSEEGSCAISFRYGK